MGPAALFQAVRGHRHLGLRGGRYRWGKEVRCTAAGGRLERDSLPGSRPTHMCFLMGCTLRSFSECANQVSHSTTMRVNKRLEGRLEDLGKNPFSWNPE